MRWRWYYSPADEENRVGAHLYDERLPSHLRAAGVPEELISQLREGLDALRTHVRTDGHDKTSWVENMDLDRLYEVVDDIHIWLNEADRRHRASQPASIGSRGTKSDHKSLTGTPA